MSFSLGSFFFLLKLLNNDVTCKNRNKNRHTRRIIMCTKRKRRRVTHRDLAKKIMKKTERERKKTDISDRSRERERKRKVLRHLEEETILKNPQKIFLCFLLISHIIQFLYACIYIYILS